MHERVTVILHIAHVMSYHEPSEAEFQFSAEDGSTALQPSPLQVGVGAAMPSDFPTRRWMRCGPLASAEAEEAEFAPGHWSCAFTRVGADAMDGRAHSAELLADRESATAGCSSSLAAARGLLDLSAGSATGSCDDSDVRAATNIELVELMVDSGVRLEAERQTDRHGGGQVTPVLPDQQKHSHLLTNLAAPDMLLLREAGGASTAAMSEAAASASSDGRPSPLASAGMSYPDRTLLSVDSDSKGEGVMVSPAPPPHSRNRFMVSATSCGLRAICRRFRSSPDTGPSISALRIFCTAGVVAARPPRKCAWSSEDRAADRWHSTQNSCREVFRTCASASDMPWDNTARSAWKFLSRAAIGQ